jgi:predicted nucleic acid-binding protein
MVNPLGKPNRSGAWGARITTVTRLETGYAARSGSGLRAAFQQPPLSSMPVEYLTSAIEDRAVEILTLLADRGQHRGPSIPDLIIAATAELAGLTVLHLDKDFDLIAEITGQPMERLNLDQTDEPLRAVAGPGIRCCLRTSRLAYSSKGRFRRL